MIIEISQLEAIKEWQWAINKNKNLYKNGISLVQGLFDKKTNPFELHYIGNLVEAAASKYLQIDIDRRLYRKQDYGNYPTYDVGKYECRGSLNPRMGLRLRPNNPKNVPYILGIVYKNPRRVDLVGWGLGVEVAKNEYWQGDSWLMPQNKLRPMSTIFQYLEKS